ncbi:MAG: sialate O-acetylesterase [Bacteroidales bacterium]|nr:T9SS type A sorting domain-containing protein [Bacteroidales bacterium]
MKKFTFVVFMIFFSIQMYLSAENRQQLQKLTSETVLKLSLPNLFGDNMVLQQNTNASIWGWAPAGTTVTITASWGYMASSISDSNGKWMTNIQTPIALQGQAPVYTLVISDGTSTIKYNNVMIGEVWLCSGQSNMMYRMDPKWPDYSAEVAAANYPNIRFFQMPRTTSTVPLDDCNALWVSCNTTNVKTFSPAAYFFGRELFNHPAVNVPIGLIQNACGQSSIQAWMKREILVSDSDLRALYLDNNYSNPYQTPTNIYNAMMAPIFPFTIKGCIWYQGEANINNGKTYTKANIALINDWRKDMDNDFSFYAAQVAPYFWATGQTKDLSARTGYFREAQSAITELPKTGIIVTTDILGDSSQLFEIHPYDKRTVGKRFAYLALAKDYGQNVQYLGPQYASHSIEGNKVRVIFKPESLGCGLCTSNGMSARCFKIAGLDKKFYPALALLDGNQVIVSSEYVNTPVAVRYAFSEGAMTNLMNKEGFAAFPFRTDEWTSETYIDMAEPSVSNNTSLEFVQFNELKFFPNPVQDKIYIDLAGKKIQKVDVLDLTGKKILSQDVSGSMNVTLNVSFILKGLYLIRVQGPDNKMMLSKFIKI